MRRVSMGSRSDNQARSRLSVVAVGSYIEFTQQVDTKFMREIDSKVPPFQFPYKVTLYIPTAQADMQDSLITRGRC